MSRRQRQRRVSALPQNAESKGRARPRGKGSARPGWLVKGGLGFVVFLLVGILGGYLWVKSYLRSDEFRQQLGKQLGGAVGGQAEVGSIEWHGTAMEIEEVTVQGSKGGSWLLRDLDTAVDLSKFWDKVWVVPKIEIRQARSEWDFQEKKAVTQESRSASGKKSARRTGWIFLPNRAEVNEVVVQDYEGEVRLENREFSWDGVRLKTEPNNQVATLIEIEGGRLQTPFDWLGSLQLETGALTLRAGEVKLEQSKWITDAGLLELSGDLVAAMPRYRATIEDWAIQPLVPAEWSSFVSGRATGTFDWGAEFAEGEILLEGGRVKGLSFLNRLAAYAGAPRLRSLSFEEASAKISRQGESWQLKDIVLFDEGLLRVEGFLFKKPEGPSGTLQVGVLPGLLAHIPGAEEKVFLPGRGGLLWTELTISGTWQNPKEDLSERLIQAAGERMFELIPETGQWALRYSATALDQGTQVLLENQEIVLEEGAKAVEEVIKEGSNVVEEGVRTGFGILNEILGGE